MATKDYEPWAPAVPPAQRGVMVAWARAMSDQRIDELIASGLLGPVSTACLLVEREQRMVPTAQL